MKALLSWLLELLERYRKPVPEPRVGLLNDGSLVIVTSCGHVEFISAETTDLICDTLARQAEAFGTAALRAGGTQ